MGRATLPAPKIEKKLAAFKIDSCGLATLQVPHAHRREIESSDATVWTAQRAEDRIRERERAASKSSLS